MLSQGSSAAAVNDTSKRMTESECSNEPNSLWIIPLLQIFGVCFGSYEEGEGTVREWLQCSCDRWIHQDCI